ncbi:MAG: 3D domain-containing protein, partial [Verrucomicrobiota bacterium]
MKLPLALTFSCVLLAVPAFSGAESKSGYVYKPKKHNVRITAYTHTEDDHLIWGKKNAIGGTLKYTTKYTSAAADWSRYPLGTVFKIDGINRTYVVDDFGSALTNKDVLDLYCPSKAAMNKWGMRWKDITIIKHGDFDKSLEYLRKGGPNALPHVKTMIASIEKMQQSVVQPEEEGTMLADNDEKQPAFQSAAPLPPDVNYQ